MQNQQYVEAQMQMPAINFYNNLRNWLNRLHTERRENEYFIMSFQDAYGQNIRITHIGFQNPNLIVLIGVDSVGNKTVLLSHVSSVQLHVKFVQLTTESAEEPERRRIGFIGDTMSSTQ